MYDPRLNHLIEGIVFRNTKFPQDYQISSKESVGVGGDRVRCWEGGGEGEPLDGLLGQQTDVSVETLS